MRRASILVIAVAAACESTAPAAPAAKGAPPVPKSAQALADVMSPDVVGALAPVEPVAGDYAMSLKMSFEVFPTTEMRITDSRTGAMRLTLAADGTARACEGARSHHEVFGQWEYRRDGNNEHRESTGVVLFGLAGTWKLVDGVAEIRFDRLVSQSCDASAAEALPEPYTELRCIATRATAKLPERSLICQASDKHIERAELGMPMTVASHVAATTPMHATPEGRELVLTSPGVAVDVEQIRDATLPAFTFTATAAVVLDEAAYRVKTK
jgi:hypothetical protein|nr:hypothetical protein [Kofleriaceae bacterium]